MFEFALPDLGEGVAEGEILEWHVAPGDAVEADDILLEVETDKAAVDVPSPVDGTVAERHGEAGDVVETGAIVVTIDTDGDAPSADAADESTPESEADATDADATDAGDTDEGSDAEPTPAPAGNDQRVFAPPSVRRLARELGVDVAQVSGSGPSGRVTEDDVRAVAESGGAAPEAEGTTEESTGEERKQLKSAVRRVGESDQETEEGEKSGEDEAEDGSPTSVVSRVGDTESEDGGDDVAGSGADEGDDAGIEPASASAEASEPAVKSAVSAVGSTAERDQTLATPATRRLARELDVNVDAVPTDVSRDGEPFVDEAAVRAYAEQQDTAAAAEAVDAEAVETTETMGTTETAETAPVGRETAAVESQSVAESGSATAAPTEESEISVAHTEEYRGIRRRIGEQMARSRREVPHATHHDRVEVSELVAARERLEPLAEDRGVGLTYTPFILKCVGAALKDHPVLNTRIDTDAEEIYYLDDYHVGVATDTDRGLLVPVVQDVDGRGIMDLAAATNDIVERARDGSIDRSEMQGGTFTVTNVGAIGGEYADPVINVPQTAVLAVGALRERPVAVDGTVEAKPTLPLSLAIDHRVIDGADAARFTNTLKTYLADPTRLLLE